MTEIKKTKQRTTAPSWRDKITITPNPFGESAFRRSIEQKIDILDESLTLILKKALPNHNYEKLRKSATADIEEGRVAHGTQLPILEEIAPSDDSTLDINNAVFALYYTALAEIENSSGNTENALKALIEADYLRGFIAGYQYVAAELKGEERIGLGRPGGKMRQEMLKRITAEAARLLADLAPPEGWRFKTEATNAIQSSLDDFIQKEHLGKVMKQTAEFLRKGYSTKQSLDDAYRQNSAKYRGSKS